MSKMLVGSINLSKIDKTKIIDGEKGKYVNLVVWINDEEDKFGNCASIQQSKDKDEKDAPTNYLGNLKEIKLSNSETSSVNGEKDEIDDLPF